MHRSRLGTIVVDCRTDDLDGAAAFWARALGRRSVALSDPDDATYRGLVAPDGEVHVLVQAVDDVSRVHLDIETDDVEAEVRRLETLGARRVAKVKRWWVLQAPTGQRFCVVPPQREDFATHANVWPTDTSLRERPTSSGIDAAVPSSLEQTRSKS